MPLSGYGGQIRGLNVEAEKPGQILVLVGRHAIWLEAWINPEDLGGGEKSRYTKKIECVELSDFYFWMFWELSLYSEIRKCLVRLNTGRLRLRLGLQCVLGGLMHVSGLFVLCSGCILGSKQVMVAALLIFYKQAKWVILFKNHSLFLAPLYPHILLLAMICPVSLCQSWSLLIISSPASTYHTLHIFWLNKRIRLFTYSINHFVGACVWGFLKASHKISPAIWENL